MAMRLSGLMSGMDTDSIVQELVAVRRTKVDSVVKAQTKLEWKQEAWKELNTKLKNLQTKYISDMRLSASYGKKTTKLSDESVASIITSDTAINSVQTLEVSKLAKTAYLTGGKVKYSGTGAVSAMSKLSDLGYTSADSGTINIKAGGKEIALDINGNTTISDVMNKLKEAGLNASFDAKNQRLFVSAKNSGAAGDFSITADDENGNAALKALGLQTALNPNASADKMDVTTKEYMTYASYYVAGDKDATIANMQSLIDATVASKVDSYYAQYKALVKTRDEAQEKVDEINAKYASDPLDTVENYTTQIEEKNEAIKELKKSITDLETEIAGLSDGADKEAKQAELEAKQAELETANEELEELTTKKSDAQVLETQKDTVDKIANIEQYISIEPVKDEDGNEVKDAEGNVTYAAKATQKLVDEVSDSYCEKAEYAANYIDEVKTQIANGTYEAGATKVAGEDAVIMLNGAEFTNSNNVFEINGLTITVNSETEAGKPVTLTTREDVDGIYDMVKNFFKEYNTLINEMDKLYNADVAKDFEPLTDEEKEALSEKEVEKYEQKIKDALLRRDSNLSAVSSALKAAMSSGYNVDGRTMYLSDFGISTLGYFTAAENERNAYHIDGDKDDSATSGNEEKLKMMISTDSETVVSFFSALANKLYDSMSNLTRSSNGYRSFGSFYDDKKLKSDYTDYTSKIAQMEQKLADYEDKWYAKFSAMEKAMAKMQSNTNAVTSLLGG